LKNNLIINEPLVSAKWLYNNLEAENLVILDASMNKVTSNAIQSSSEVKIPQARFFDIKNNFSKINAPFPNTVPSKTQFTYEARALGINNNSAIVVYDDKGIYSSPRVWWLFKTFGYDNIAVLDGGLPEWKKSNYSLENKKDLNIEIGNIALSFRHKYFNFFNDIRNLSNEDQHIIVDARSVQRFEELVEEPREGLRCGIIPNSINLPYTEVLVDNCLRPEAELITIFNTLVDANTHLIFSCGSGITACILALAAYIAGFKNLSVYDGSWTEYGSLILE
jgi:thiosulfate/3-mercaptopyruvate sulfurtransferase